MSPKRRRIVAQPVARRTPEREPLKITDWVQAVAALVAAVLAGWAVLVALDSFRDQQQINRSQAELNRLALERAEQRYASRVAWWQDAADPKLIHVQNRAPVPLTSVLITADYGDLVKKAALTYPVPNIAPCVVVTLRIPKLPEEMTDPEAGTTYTTGWSLVFRDPVVGGWERTEGGLSRQSRDYTFTTGTPVLPVVKEEPTEDCGEGG